MFVVSASVSQPIKTEFAMIMTLAWRAALQHGAASTLLISQVSAAMVSNIGCLGKSGPTVLGLKAFSAC